MAIAIYELGSLTWELHHIRNPNDNDIIYDPRVQPLEDPVLRGRCELNTDLDAQEKARAIKLLSDFGNDKSYIPELGVGNCQDWVVDAVTMLERAGSLMAENEGAFWRGMINLSAEQMKARCLESGRVWVQRSPDLGFDGVPDARFSDEGDEVKQKGGVGKLAQNPIFKDRMRALMGGGSQGGESPQAAKSAERPFYVSSPFFNHTG